VRQQTKDVSAEQAQKIIGASGAQQVEPGVWVVRASGRQVTIRTSTLPGGGVRMVLTEGSCIC
jgi:hypothetical protein